MNKRLSITFSTIYDLLGKVEAIKEFALFQKQIRANKLDELGIVYEYLDEYGVAIDIDKQTPEQMLAIKEVLSDNTLEEFIKIL